MSDSSVADARPVIVTARFDPTTFARLDAMRRAYFPAARNHLPAHLTLFHHLPAARCDDVVLAAHRACRRDDACRSDGWPLHFTGLRFLGRGVSLAVTSSPLMLVRAEIASAFSSELTQQDRQGFKPHVTVQNKVEPAEARALHVALSRDFEPWSGVATGLCVWRYDGGPWSRVAEVSFA